MPKTKCWPLYLALDAFFLTSLSLSHVCPDVVCVLVLCLLQDMLCVELKSLKHVYISLLDLLTSMLRVTFFDLYKRSKAIKGVKVKS